MDVVGSWDRFKDTLERLPMKRELNLLETMKLDIFPQQEETFPVRFPNLEREIEHPSLVGEEINFSMFSCQHIDRRKVRSICHRE